jgi:Zn-dependent protease with chaperone function
MQVGHEIGHALARHHAEQSVTQRLGALIVVAAALLGFEEGALELINAGATVGLRE